MRFLLYNIKYGTNNLGRWSWVSFMSFSSRHFMNLKRFVTAVDADVIGLVEVDAGSYRSHGRNQARALSELGYTMAVRSKYRLGTWARSMPVLRSQSNALLTRLPVVATRYHDFSVGMKRLVIEVELKDVSLFLVHLALVGQVRHQQLAELAQLVRASKKPCIVAGDFNFLSGVWEASLFMEATGLRSANVQGRPTFPSWAPTKVLDFVFHDEKILLKRLRIPSIIVSDHLPIVCDFEIQHGCDVLSCKSN